ncbi:MAG: HlyD family secretion protein [Sphingomonadales bacterium]|nr:MAG: HlyD family secretion protein [Sphingomonadales bacterium]
MAALAVAGAIYGYRSWSFGQTHAATDDAQVASRIAAVAPKVAGTVREVLVEDNELVHRGQLLAVIGPSSYKTAVDQAKANLALAQAQERQAEVNIQLTNQTGNAQIAQAQGGVGQSQGAINASLAEVGRAQAAVAAARAQASGAEANIKGAQAAYRAAVANVARSRDAVREAQALAANARAGVEAAEANVTAARATEERARSDAQRYQTLLSQGVVSAQTAEQAQAAYRVATAQREAAEENVRSARATLQQRQAAIGTAQSGVAAAQAQVTQASAQVQANRVAAVAAGENIRQASAGVLTAQSGVTQAQAKARQAVGSLQQANTAGTQVEISRVALEQARARVSQAKAALADAVRNLGDTKIYAPIDGRVSHRTATLGQQVQSGTALMQIVPERELWVVANFKETQLKNVRVGQPAEIEVDAFGGEPLKGHVESLSPGTGATFALLPPDNATGNFTKVVQRIPIRIAFDPGQPRLEDLAVGMSVNATIETSNAKGGR